MIYSDFYLISKSSGAKTLLSRATSKTFDTQDGFSASTISFSIPTEDARAVGLAEGSFISVTVDDYTLPTPFVIESSGWDYADVDSVSMSEFKGRSIHALGEDDVVLPSAWPNPTPSGHAFQNATPGTIIRTLISRSQERGKIMEWDVSSFSGTVDSKGKPWPAMMDREFSNGDGIYSAIKSIVDDGLVELEFDGFTLKAYVPGTLGVLRKQEDIIFRAGYSISEGSLEKDSSDFATDIFAIGEGGATAYETRPALYGVLGRRRTKFVQYAGISNVELLKVLAKADLDRYSSIKMEDSISVPHQIYQPMKDFFPGDWVAVDRGDGTNTVVKVKQISFSESTSGWSVGISLGTLLDSQEEKIQRRLDAITGANAGGGAVPSDKAQIKQAPAKPQNLKVSVQPYLDNQSRRKVIALADWSDVLVYDNGQPLDGVDGYEVSVKAGNATDYGPIQRVADSGAVFSGYDPDTKFQFRVKAYAGGYASAWVESPVVTLVDNTPLVISKPSVPELKNSWQTILVSWDGKNADGTYPSLDLIGMEVHLSAVQNFTPTSATRVGFIPWVANSQVGGNVVATDLEASTKYYVVFVPLGTKGTPGTKSDYASVTTAERANSAVVNQMKTDLDKAKEDLYNPGGTVDTIKNNLTGQITAGDKAVDDRALSRGTDLVTNGTGTLGTNYNFSGFYADKTDAPPGAVLSMYQTKGVQVVASTDEFMAVDTSKTYKLDAYIRQRGTSKTATSYVGLAAYDAYKLNLNPQFVCWISGTTTTLAADLNPGDTKIKISSTNGWYGTSARSAGNATQNRSIIWWDYVDQGGKAWPVESYSRNWSGADYWADGAIAGDGTITLRSPYSGPKRLAGTPLSNGTSGGAYIYGFSSGIATSEWKKLSQLNGYVNNGLITGVATGGALPSFATGFPAGTAYVRVVMLPNWSDVTNSQVAFAGVSLSDTSAAQVAALSAATAASTAQAAANAAKSTADAAKSTADAANTAAANAAGIANGKADVLIQSTAPAAAMQKASTLWIDTTNNANTPKRWSGSTWVVVTDKAAVDAANAAANAQATANQAKTDAANAQAKADQAARDAAAAQATANSAVSKADAAQTSANGKNKIYWDKAAPANLSSNPNGQVGDVWNKYALVNNKVTILATWQWTSDNQWVSSALDRTYLPQVDIGTGTFGELDGMRLKAKSVQANNILVEGSAGSTVIADGAIITSKIAALAVTADQIAANAITADKIAANAITANHINAQSIGAAIGEFVKIKADQIDTGFLNASIGIGTSGIIIAGDWSKSYATMSANGFATYGVTGDGQQYQATTLGGLGADQLSISGLRGEVASITNEGNASFNSLSVDEDIDIAGINLLGTLFNPEDPSISPGWLDKLPRGPVVLGDVRPKISSMGSVSGAGAYAFAKLGFVMDPTRMYRVSMPYRYEVSGISSGAPRVGITTNYEWSLLSEEPAEPTRSSTRVSDNLRSYTANTSGVADTMYFIWRPADWPAPINVKVLFSVWVDAGCTFTPSVYNAFDWQINVEDIGPKIEDTADIVIQGGSTTPAKKTYVSTWVADNSQTYYQNGSRDSYGQSSNITRSGYWNSISGDMKTCYTFNGGAISGEEGKTIASALPSGATVTKVEVFVQTVHWYNTTGGTLVVRNIDGSTMPSTLSDATAKSKPEAITRKYSTRNQGQWITVPETWFTSANRMFLVGPAASTWQGSYNHLANHAHPNTAYRPKVRITYTR